MAPMIQRFHPHLLAAAILLSPALALAESATAAPAAAALAASGTGVDNTGTAASPPPSSPSPALAPATVATPSTTPAPSASSDLSGSLMQLGFGFTVVMAVLFGCLWLLKRLSTPHGRTGGLMKVVTSLPLGTRERAVLIEVGGQWLLIGMGPNYMVKLGELPRQDVPPAPQGPAVPDFSAWLKRALERKKGSDTDA